MKKDKIFRIIGHVIFWLITAYAFTHFSYLRSLLTPVYKELFVVSFLAIMVYLHYFVLIPCLFQRKLFVAYWSITFVFLLLLSMLEMFFNSNYLQNVKENMEADLFPPYIFSLFITLFLRNAEFWAFLFILRLYGQLKNSMVNKETAILNETDVIAVLVCDNQTITVNINELSYVRCIRNKCRLHMKNSTVYEQYASLSHWEELLASHGAIRVNRDTLVMLHAIVSFTNDSMLLIPSETNIIMYKGDKKNEVFDYLCEHIPSKQAVTQENVRKGDLSSENGALNDEFEKNGALNFVNLEEFLAIIAGDKDMISICSRIIFFPFSNAKDIAANTQISYRTVEKKLQYLKENNIIQYEGARKNGNYAFTPYVSDEVKAWLMNKEGCQLLNE